MYSKYFQNTNCRLDTRHRCRRRGSSRHCIPKGNWLKSFPHPCRMHLILHCYKHCRPDWWYWCRQWTHRSPRQCMQPYKPTWRSHPYSRSWQGTQYIHGWWLRCRLWSGMCPMNRLECSSLQQAHYNNSQEDTHYTLGWWYWCRHWTHTDSGCRPQCRQWRWFHYNSCLQDKKHRHDL